MVASVCPWCGNWSPAVLRRVAKTNGISIRQAISTTPNPQQAAAANSRSAEATQPEPVDEKTRQALERLSGSSASTTASPPSGGGGTDLAAQLEKLVGLHATGGLTADEFAAAKARLLSSG
jgi:hypothetical protein